MENSGGQSRLRTMSTTLVRRVASPSAATTDRCNAGGTSASSAAYEAGAHQHAVRPQHQGRRQPAPVGDAAGGEHQGVGTGPSAQIADLRHQRGVPAHGPVPARLGALGDDDLGAGVDGAPGLGQGLDLADQRGTGGAHLVGERHRIAEGQHDRSRLVRSSARVSRCGCNASDQVMKPQPTS